MKDRSFLSVCSFALLLLLFSSQTVSGDNDSIPDELEEDLANQYAPYLYLHPDEKFYPVSTSYAISRSDLKDTEDQGAPISTNPTVDMLDDYNDPEEGIYLDNREGTIDDKGIEEDFLSNRDEYTPVVHARVTLGSSGEYVVQYWMFYPFNDGPLNRHEGDWEMISVFLDGGTSPMYVGYSQHLGGERAGWGLTYKQGTHPKVYVALGSHANYLRPYEGGLGLAQDEVSDEGRVLGPDDYDIVLLGEKGTGNHPDDQAWLDFAGHWGDYGAPDAGVRGERGPQGPVYFEDGKRWDTPVEWSSDINGASDTWFTLNWVVAYFIFIVIGIMFLVILIHVLLKARIRRRQGTLGPRLLPFLYIDGVNLKSIGLMVGIVALIVSIIGFFLPWYTVSVNVDSGEYATGGHVDILTIDGYNGLQFNKLDSGNGLVQLFGLPIPFAWILLLSLIVFFFSTIGIRESKKMGTKFIGRGVITLIPILIIIIFIMQLSGLTSSFAGDAPPEVNEIIDEISSSPFSGQTERSFGEYGNAELRWGLGPGAYLLILSTIMFFVGTVLEIKAHIDFYGIPGLIEGEKESKEIPDEDELEGTDTAAEGKQMEDRESEPEEPTDDGGKEPEHDVVMEYEKKGPPESDETENDKV